MNIALFFGSFNPIHIGHLILANHIAEQELCEAVWFVVSPHNPLKQRNSLLPDQFRLEMVYLATKNYDKLKGCDIEFYLPKPSYTINTLTHLKDKYPMHNFSIIMGSDNLYSFEKWRNYEYILENYNILVYPRITEIKNGNGLDKHPNVKIIDAPIIEISASFVIEQIKKKKNFRPLLDENVWKYIDKNGFYS